MSSLSTGREGEKWSRRLVGSVEVRSKDPVSAVSWKVGEKCVKEQGLLLPCQETRGAK